MDLRLLKWICIAKGTHQDLVDHISSTLPNRPDEIIDDLVTNSGLTLKDAKTLASIDDGERLDYFDEVRDHVNELLDRNVSRAQSASGPQDEASNPASMAQSQKSNAFDETIANW